MVRPARRLPDPGLPLIDSILADRSVSLEERGAVYTKPEVVGFILNRVQFENRRFQFRSSPSGRPWKVGTTGFKLDAV